MKSLTRVCQTHVKIKQEGEKSSYFFAFNSAQFCYIISSNEFVIFIYEYREIHQRKCIKQVINVKRFDSEFNTESISRRDKLTMKWKRRQRV